MTGRFFDVLYDIEKPRTRLGRYMRDTALAIKSLLK